MYAGNKYLMYGVFPIKFTENGLWCIDIDCAPIRKTATLAVKSLLGVNAAVEAATFHQVKMCPPLRRRDSQDGTGGPTLSRV